MGNMQFTLDKTFDSIPVKDASSAKDIIAAIKKTEDKKDDEDKKLEKDEKLPEKNNEKKMFRYIAIFDGIDVGKSG